MFPDTINFHWNLDCLFGECKRGYEGVTRRLRMVPVDVEGQRQRVEVKHQPLAYAWLISVLCNSLRYVFICVYLAHYLAHFDIAMRKLMLE